MAHQYMPKIFHESHKNPLVPPFYILNMQSLTITFSYPFYTEEHMSEYVFSLTRTFQYKGRMLILREYNESEKHCSLAYFT